MPSTAAFVRLCQERNFQIPQTLAAVEARLAQFHVDSSTFNSPAAKREAVATLIWALAAIPERRNKSVYSRWNHLSPSSLQAIRKLNDVPQERGRPASLAKVARHFGTIDLLVVQLLFMQQLSVSPRGQPAPYLTAGSLVRLRLLLRPRQ